MKTLVKEDIEEKIIKIDSIVSSVSICMVSISKLSMKFIMDADNLYGNNKDSSLAIKEKFGIDPEI
jgi:hypothetical protein